MATRLRRNEAGLSYHSHGLRNLRSKGESPENGSVVTEKGTQQGV